VNHRFTCICTGLIWLIHLIAAGAAKKLLQFPEYYYTTNNTCYGGNIELNAECYDLKVKPDWTG